MLPGLRQATLTASYLALAAAVQAASSAGGHHHPHQHRRTSSDDAPAPGDSAYASLGRARARHRNRGRRSRGRGRGRGRAQAGSGDGDANGSADPDSGSGSGSGKGHRRRRSRARSQSATLVTVSLEGGVHDLRSVADLCVGAGLGAVLPPLGLSTRSDDTSIGGTSTEMAGWQAGTSWAILDDHCYHLLLDPFLLHVIHGDAEGASKVEAGAEAGAGTGANKDVEHADDALTSTLVVLRTPPDADDECAAWLAGLMSMAVIRPDDGGTTTSSAYCPSSDVGTDAPPPSVVPSPYSYAAPPPATRHRRPIRKHISRLVEEGEEEEIIVLVGQDEPPAVARFRERPVMRDKTRARAYPPRNSHTRASRIARHHWTIYSFALLRTATATADGTQCTVHGTWYTVHGRYKDAPSLGPSQPALASRAARIIPYETDPRDGPRD